MSDKFIKLVDDFWLGNTEMRNLGGQLKMKTQLQKHQCCMSWSHKNNPKVPLSASTVTWHMRFPLLSFKKWIINSENSGDWMLTEM